MTENRSVVAGYEPGVCGGSVRTGHKEVWENLGEWWLIHYLNCSDGFLSMLYAKIYETLYFMCVQVYCMWITLQ